MGNNHTHVSKGFRTLLGAMAPYLAREFRTEFGKDWWKVAVMETLWEEQSSQVSYTRAVKGDER